MHDLTEAQCRALDAAAGLPAHIALPNEGRSEVLLDSADFNWVRGVLGDEPDAPRLRDPRTNATYVLLPAERYERFKAFFEEDPLTPTEQLALLREAGRRAGWTQADAEPTDGP